MPTQTLFKPTWEGPIHGYTVKYISKNGWQVRGADWEDLIQEAYLVYLECVDRYISPIDNPVDTPQWFMALYKRCLFTRMTDLANQSTASQAINESSLCGAVDEDEHGDFSFDAFPAPIGVTYEFLELIEKAPNEVALVLSLMFNAPNEVLDLAQSAWRASGRKKVQGNTFLCNLLGLDPTKIHLPTSVTNYFHTGAWKM